MVGKLFDNPKPALYAIAAFVLLLLLAFSCTSRGEELRFEVGSATVRGETPAIGLELRWPLAGPVNTDYEVGFLLSGTSNHYRDNPNAFTGYGMIVDGWKKAEIGLGVAYTNVEWEYTCKLTAALMARYRFTNRVAVQWRHFSSAGSCNPNAGRDFATISWRF
jgi:hypothetical protein